MLTAYGMAREVYEQYLLDATAETVSLQHDAKEQLALWMSRLRKTSVSVLGPSFKRHVAKICRKVGVRGTTQTRQSRHLPFDDPSMEKIRQFVDVAVSGMEVHPRLICNFDQVWCMQYEPPTRSLFKQQDDKGKAPADKPSKRRLRAKIAEILGVGCSGDGEHISSRSRQAKLCAGSTMVPVEYGRHPRTTTTLSWCDGTLGRAYVTANTTVVPVSVVDKMNAELAGIMYIEKSHAGKTHMWSKDTMVSYLQFLSQEIRAQRLRLNILLCDAAAVHSVRAHAAIRKRFEAENNCIIVSGHSDEPGRPCIPGEWGATGAPNDA